MENINLETTAMEKAATTCEAVVTAFAIQGQLTQTLRNLGVQLVWRLNPT